MPFGRDGTLMGTLNVVSAAGTAAAMGFPPAGGSNVMATGFRGWNPVPRTAITSCTDPHVGLTASVRHGTRNSIVAWLKNSAMTSLAVIWWPLKLLATLGTCSVMLKVPSAFTGALVSWILSNVNATVPGAAQPDPVSWKASPGRPHAGDAATVSF